MRSMTGFGRFSSKSPLGTLFVELQSVNRRYLEVAVSLPLEWSPFEMEVRKLISQKISRGAVSLRVSLSGEGLERRLPDPKILSQLKKRWEEIAEEAGLERSGITLPFLCDYLPEGRERGEEAFEPLKEGVEGALKGLIAMREAEGQALAQDLRGRLAVLKGAIDAIEKLAPLAVEKGRGRLLERLQECLPGTTAHDERLLKEVALLAEKIDITEEIVRFRSHLKQMERLFQDEGELGKRLEFLLQEMGREVNTIGSKSLEAEVSHRVIEMKAELEKMREQAQNIE